jgi:GNAT superfamily N-acetyltransferase
MGLTKIPYTADYYLEILDFLVETYQPIADHHNWQIDRWNFSRYVSQVIHETEDTWPETVGLWVDDRGVIQAVVHSEGENRGDVHFQLALRRFSDQDLGSFLDHAEKHLAVEGDDGQMKILPWAGRDFRQLTDLMEERGYRRTGRTSQAGQLVIAEHQEVKIPIGMQLVDKSGFTDQARGRAHSLAFGYGEEGRDMVEKFHIIEAFRNMRLAPSYRPELDLAVLSPEGEVAAFACFWLDARNAYGVLEPLGTVPDYQRLGLASALIMEGMNRLRRLGAKFLYGPVNQEFYRRVGFFPVYEFEIWKKTLPGIN